MGFFDRFRRLFRPAKHSPQKPADPAAVLLHLLRAIECTQEEELPCDEACALVDQFAEMVRRGEDAAGLMPLVQQHLGLCNDCREEYEALLRVLQSLPA